MSIEAQGPGFGIVYTYPELDSLQIYRLSPREGAVVDSTYRDVQPIFTVSLKRLRLVCEFMSGFVQLERLFELRFTSRNECLPIFIVQDSSTSETFLQHRRKTVEIAPNTESKIEEFCFIYYDKPCRFWSDAVFPPKSDSFYARISLVRASITKVAQRGSTGKEEKCGGIKFTVGPGNRRFAKP